MTRDRLMRVSERWFRLLLRLYPADFRDEMGIGVVEAYGDRARVTLNRSGAMGLAWLWLRALADAPVISGNRIFIKDVSTLALWTVG